jgi:hypothetical protein
MNIKKKNNSLCWKNWEFESGMSFLDFHFSRKKYLFFPSHSRKKFYFSFSNGGILQNTDGRHSLTLILIFFSLSNVDSCKYQTFFCKNKYWYDYFLSARFLQKNYIFGSSVKFWIECSSFLSKNNFNFLRVSDIFRWKIPCWDQISAIVCR